MGKKVRIRILDEEFDAPAEDSILRALQLFGIARRLPAYGFGRFCWNASCKQCIVEYERDGIRTRDFACQTSVGDGMRVRSVPHVLLWKNLLKIKNHA